MGSNSSVGQSMTLQLTLDQEQVHGDMRIELTNNSEYGNN